MSRQIQTINPTTGEPDFEYQTLSGEEIEASLARAAERFESWRRTPFSTRSEALLRVAEKLDAGKDSFARLMALEMGKPLAQGRAETEKCAWVCRYYAEHAEEFLQDQTIPAGSREDFVSYRPIGPVLAIMPWNFPFWQVFRFAAPNLMAGNVGLLKHASNVPRCSLAIQEVIEEAGFPEGCFTSLLIDSGPVNGIIADRRVRAVTLTGSTAAGKKVAAAAGEHLKKTVLELGGSDPYVILEDADLDLAARTCATSRLINSGQSCIAAKRFVVVREVLDAFTEKLTEEMRQKKVGNPLDESTGIGPQARHDLRDELHEQVKKSLESGATAALGCELPSGEPGAYYPASVLTNVRPGMPAYDEELFGPVASIIAANDETDAIRIANATVFGLGAAVFTRDEARGRRIAREELDAGGCAVNRFVASDPRLPFGGVKDSGYGRELGLHGIHEFVNIKTVSVGTADA